MSDERDDARVRALLRDDDAPAVPPFEALAARRRRGALGRTVPFTLTAVLAAAAALVAGQQLAAYREQAAASRAPSPSALAPATSASPSGAADALPRPIPQPVTRTSAAAQVAWVGVFQRSGSSLLRDELVGVGPQGSVVGRIGRSVNGEQRTVIRSGDGELLVAIGAQRIDLYSALDGRLVRSYPRGGAGPAVDAAVSADGRWLAVLGEPASLQLVDLGSGATRTTGVEPARQPNTPGLSGSTSRLVWSTLAFSPDSRRLVALLNWGGPLRVSVYDVAGLTQTGTAVDGEGGRKLPDCAGPGLAARIRPDGRTLVTFCFVDGTVRFIDLDDFVTEVLDTRQPNPFWQGPIFTPDGQILYLHQYPPEDMMTAVDLTTRRVVGKRSTPRTVGAPGIFSWLFPVAYAGYTPSTNPVSPDGLRVYAVAADGITVLRVPDLAPVARLAEGLRLNEAWVSGDGKTVYATAQQSAGGQPGALYVMPADGSKPPVEVTLEGTSSVFYP